MLKEVTVMDNMYYLLNVTVAGVKCIEEEIRLDFYKKIVNQKFDADKYRIKAIYGENGSGPQLLPQLKYFRILYVIANT